MQRPTHKHQSFSISLATSNLLHTAHKRFGSASSNKKGLHAIVPRDPPRERSGSQQRPSTAVTLQSSPPSSFHSYSLPRRAMTVRDRMTKKRRSLSLQAIFNPPLDSPTSESQPQPSSSNSTPPITPPVVTSPRASPPPAFLLDDDPFANLTATPADTHRVSAPPVELSSQPRSPLTPSDSPTSPSAISPNPKSPTLPSKSFSARAPTPAHQKPAFAPKPSLPSLDALARMNVVLTKKVRKGRVGAGLPFEPWDHHPDTTDVPKSPTRSRRPSTSPASEPAGFAPLLTSPTSPTFPISPADSYPSLASASSEPSFIQPSTYNNKIADGEHADVDLLATCGVDLDSSSVLIDTPPRSKIKGRKQSIALDQPPPEFFSSRSRPPSRSRPSTSPGFSSVLSRDFYHDKPRDADIFTLRDSVPRIGLGSGSISPCNPTSPRMDLDENTRRSQFHTSIAGISNTVDIDYDALAGPVSTSSDTTMTFGDIDHPGVTVPAVPPASRRTTLIASSNNATVVVEVDDDVPDITPTPTPVPPEPVSASSVDHILTTVPEYPSDMEEDEERDGDSILLAYTSRSPVGSRPGSPTPTPEDSLHFGTPTVSSVSPDTTDTSASASRRSLTLSASSSTSCLASLCLSHSQTTSSRGSCSESSSDSSSYHLHSKSGSGSDEFILYDHFGVERNNGCHGRYGNLHYSQRLSLHQKADEEDEVSHGGSNHAGGGNRDIDLAVVAAQTETSGRERKYEGDDGGWNDIALSHDHDRVGLTAADLPEMVSLPPTARTPPRVSSKGALGLTSLLGLGRGLNNSAEGGGDVFIPFSQSPVDSSSISSSGSSSPTATTDTTTTRTLAQAIELGETSEETGRHYSHDHLFPSSWTVTELQLSSPQQQHDHNHHQHGIEGRINTRSSTSSSSLPPSSNSSSVYSDTQQQQGQPPNQNEAEEDMLAYSNYQQQRRTPRSSPSPRSSSATTTAIPTSVNLRGGPTPRRVATTTTDGKDFQNDSALAATRGMSSGYADFDPYRGLHSNGSKGYNSRLSATSQIQAQQSSVSSPRISGGGPSAPPSSWYSVNGGATRYSSGTGTQRSSGGYDETIDDGERRRDSGRRRPSDAMIVSPPLTASSSSSFVGGTTTATSISKSTRTSFGNLYSSSTSEEEDEMDSEATDDNVPLARSIPNALVAQKSIRKQVREERDQRRRQRAAAANATTTSSTSTTSSASAAVSAKGGEQTRNRQTTLKPPSTGLSATGGGSSAVAPQGMYSSSQEAAMHASALSRSGSAAARPCTAPSMSGNRQRTQTLPGRAVPPFAIEDLTKKLQDVQANTASSASAINPSIPGRQKEHPLSTDADPYAMFTRAEDSFVSPPLPPLAIEAQEQQQQQSSAAKSLRPQRSFHRPSTRPSAVEDHRSIPLPSNATQQLHRARSQTKLRDDYTLKPMMFEEASRVPVPRVSEEHRRVGREPSVRSARPSMEGYLSSTTGNGANTSTNGSSHAMERRSPSKRPSTADRDRPTTRPPVPPLPASIAQPPPVPYIEKQVVQQRVFIGDMQSFNVVEIEDTTSAGDVIEMLEAQGSLKGWIGSGDWMVWEVAHDFGVERPVRSYERLSDVQASWNKDKLVNMFVVRLTPLAPLLARSAIPSASPKFAGYVEWESKRGKWSKRWLMLREHSLWMSKRDNGKDETLLCSLSNFDAYHFCRPYKSPKPFVFAIKSTDKLSFFENTADYKHVISCSEKDGKVWMEKILLARSYVLHQERNVLFNPKSYGGLPTVASGTGAISRAATQRRPAQPLVSVANNMFFEPGSLLHRQK